MPKKNAVNVNLKTSTSLQSARTATVSIIEDEILIAAAATESRTSRESVAVLLADCQRALDRIAELSNTVELVRMSSAKQSSSPAEVSIQDKNAWLLAMLLSDHNADISLDVAKWDLFGQNLSNLHLMVIFEAKDRIGSVLLNSSHFTFLHCELLFCMRRSDYRCIWRRRFVRLADFQSQMGSRLCAGRERNRELGFFRPPTAAGVWRTT
jgi:hypothetical protein